LHHNHFGNKRVVMRRFNYTGQLAEQSFHPVARDDIQGHEEFLYVRDIMGALNFISRNAVTWRQAYYILAGNSNCKRQTQVAKSFFLRLARR